MSLVKAIADYSQYHHWANEQLTKWLKQLNRRLLYLNTPSSFNSIDLTLQHMTHAQNFWLAVINCADFTTLDETIVLDNADKVMGTLLAGSQQMVDTFTTYTEEELLQEVPTTDMVKPRYQLMQHVINHSSYHRGQIVTMSRCLGIVINIPVTDYDVFLWERG